MRTCEEYEALISAFIDGALEDGDRAELMAHMAQCPDCQAYFDDQIAIHDVMAAMEAQAPADFTARVMDQVRREPRREAAPERQEKKVVPFPYWRRFAAMAACCAVVAAAAFWAFGGRPDVGSMAVDVAAADSSRGIAAEENDADQEMAAADTGTAAKGADEEAGDAAGGDSGASRAEDGLPPEDALPPEGVQNDVTTGPETDPGQNALVPEERDNAPALYTAGQSGPVVLTTGSPVAAAWVEERLGLTWAAGESYALTQEQYGELLALLAESGESYTEDLLPQETGDPAEGGDGAAYVLQAAP